MEKESKVRQEFCGNCISHNPYNYPDQVFCTKRFLKNENPIVQALWCCGEWTPNVQECYCVQEALKKQKNKY